MRVIFLGTPDFALPSLRALAQSRHEVVLVLTRPDRPRGRGKKLHPPPVKVLAQEFGLKVAQPAKVSAPEGIALIESARPDAGVVCAYGEIISAEVLALAPGGFFNVHASLLPRFRGAAPVHHAVLSGEPATGVTVIRLVEKMDAGDIVGSVETEIGPHETTGQLTERLAVLGADALVEALDKVEAGTARFEPQDESKASYAPKISKKDARIDWSKSAGFLERFVRAMSPVPGAFTFFRRGGRTTRLIVGAARVAAGSGKPGTVIEASASRLLVATGPDESAAPGAGAALELGRLQPESKRMMSAAEFLRGCSITPDSVFE